MSHDAAETGVGDGSTPANPAESPHAGDALAPGTRIDRYEIGERLGAGGMGVVYVARDEELARDVALKVLRIDDGDDLEEMRSRLQREAQAMARLSHPNVVPVFDIGAAGGRLFIAMELVGGQSLRAWMAGPQTWREIVGVFVGAGRGLAAAHAAGIVHRDFKPDNVVGADRLPRVTDFGLARELERRRPEPATGDHAAPDATTERLGRITATGAIAGTPAYMAPEQLIGRDEIGPAADQFAFCVSLFEALYGTRPFVTGRDDPASVELLAAIVGGRIASPRDGRDRPRWLHAAIVRGLAADPDQRWPSLAALVARLERGLARRRRAVIAGVGLAALATTAIAAVVLARDPAAAAPCAEPERRVGAVWGPDPRAALAAHFDQAGGRPAFEVVADELDHYARRWTTAWSAACTATHVTRAQDQTAFAARDRCLSTRLARLGALVTVLHTATATEIQELVARPLELPPPEDCSDAGRLGDIVPLPADPAARARIDAAWRELAEVAAAEALGRTAGSCERAGAVVATARPMAYPPLLANALVQLGRCEELLGDYVAAERDLFDASNVAESVQIPLISAEARLALGRITGVVRGDHDAGLRWLEMAEAAATLAGSADLAAAALSYRGQILLARGDVDAAIAAHRLAVSAAGAASEDTMHLARGNLAETLAMAGQPDEAQRLIAAQCERVRATKPADHPYRINCEWFDLAAAQRAGDVAAARQHAENVLAASGRIFGARSDQLATAEANVAAVLVDVRAYDEARAHAERALEIARALQGPTGETTIHAVGILSVALAGQERYAESRGLLEQAIAAAEPTIGTAGIADLAVDLSDALLHTHECAAAVALLERLLATETPVGASWIATARWNLGLCETELGHAGDAIATLSRAADDARAQGDVVLAAKIRHSRALARLRQGRRQEAIEDARAALVELPETAVDARAAIEAWLATMTP